MGAEASSLKEVSRKEAETGYGDSFSEEDVDEDVLAAQSSLELAEQEILAELLRSLIDITAGPPNWTKSPLLETQGLALVVSNDESLLKTNALRPDLPLLRKQPDTD
eukprot:CAMPEP_0198647492 /NCGR_PEP_ID=MMETSP1467-20131203/2768_1 /TAXON_ID=1462469 /ORGANISM="unid. sp., Strain CCMP2135" /LENGTH=106 /DNA_ID=CAMNT_0044383125 /DNA_START=54 /DNA_END=374 /DNA_ORIENTATION=-